MHVSLSLDGRVHSVEPRDTSFKADVVDFFLSSIGATLTEIKEVELRYPFYIMRIGFPCN